MNPSRSTPFLSRLFTLLAMMIPIVFLPACGAPPAIPLEGEAAEAVTEGITSGTQRMAHVDFDRFVSTHVREEGARFDYLAARADTKDLTDYLAAVGRAPLERLNRNQLLALLINAYNACTLRAILDTIGPDSPRGVASIRDIPQVFDRKTCQVGGHRLSLNNIEHNLIRPLFRDPRIHFAVNCASIGCPPLPPHAFTGEALESQLEAAARRTLSSEKYVRVENGQVWVTKLLDWYGSDFVNEDFRGAEDSLAAYLRKYASPEVSAWIDSAGGEPQLVFLDYDWSLNITL